jgi:hypothetical protein
MTMDIQISPVGNSLTTQPEERAGDRQLRSRFLLLGLIPSVYAMRRLPLGMWIEAAALLGIGAGLSLLIGWSLYSLPLRRTVGKKLVRGGLIALGIAAAAFGMYRLDVADSQGHRLVPSGVLEALVLSAQAALTYVSLSRRRDISQAERLHTASTYAVVLATAAILAPLGRALPSAFVVVAVGLVAARFALIPVLVGGRSGRRSTDLGFTDFALFLWSAAVLCLQSRALARPRGVSTSLLAIAVGLVVILAFSHGPLFPRLTRSIMALALGSLILGSLFILVPSEESTRWLLDRNFEPPSRFDLREEHRSAGRVERWYDTTQSEDAAIVDAHLALSGLVSEWTGAYGNGIDGHIWGYHLDVRLWDGRRGRDHAPPAGHRCRDETRTCVLVVLRRSDDRESLIPFQPLRLPQVPKDELSPR